MPINKCLSTQRHFLRPLLAPDQSWAGVSCTYWPAQPPAVSESKATHLHLGGSPLVRLADSAGIAALAKKLPIVLPVSTDDLGVRDLARSLPTNTPIFALPAATELTAETIAACSALRQRGYQCARDIAQAGQIGATPDTAFNWLQIDAATARNELPLLELVRAHEAGFNLLASQVTTPQQFDWLVSRHFALLDARFIGQPDRRQQTPDTARLKLVRLLSLVIEDADTREIEEIFREDARLSYGLLRLVNSVAVGARVRIVSFRHAIDVLGRRQLKRWLQLLIYANAESRANEPNPLLTLAAYRGRMMEAICEHLSAPADLDDFIDAAFTVGIFSLLDVLLKQPMAEIVSTLPLHSAIEGALDAHEGVLGTLLHAVRASDANDLGCASDKLDALGVAPGVHLDAQAAALRWASGIGHTQPL
ncbi:HDOD domain-containing protein [Rhodocyclus tenuis]|nr:HDOD domain-containing protein [Rhodocyclus gracilis]